MHSMLKTGTAALFAAFALGASAGAVQAATLKITVTNLGVSGGLTITPVFAAFHNGSFDTFNVGDAASAGLEEIAETGSAAGIAGEMAGAQPSAVSQINSRFKPNIGRDGNWFTPQCAAGIGCITVQNRIRITVDKTNRSIPIDLGQRHTIVVARNCD